MNWYKFRIELVAFAYRVVACVLITLVSIRVMFMPEGASRHYPANMAFLADLQGVMQLGFVLGFVMLWVCYRRIFKVYRSRSAYRNPSVRKERRCHNTH